MSITSTCVVQVDGSPLPADVVPLLTSAHVDDSQQLPDTFVLRFRDPARSVLTRSGFRIGALVDVGVQQAGTSAAQPLISGEVTALEAEHGTGGTFSVVRGYDQTHRFFRGRRTEGYTQMTAADIATALARRAGLAVGEVAATPAVLDHFGQFGQTDWEVLSTLARDNNLEVAVRGGTFTLTAPAEASTAPGVVGAAEQPLVLHLGTDLLRLRSVLTAARQVGEVEVRGWDTASKQPLRATRTAGTTRTELPTVTPGDLARLFGSPSYVSSDAPLRSQAEVDAAAAALADEVAGSFAELEGVARGNPALRAGAAVSVVGAGEPFDGKYTVTTSRHRFDPTTGYTTSFAVTGRQDRTLLGLATAPRPGVAAAGVVVALVSDVSDPEGSGRVRLTFPWLSDDYVSDWARTVHAGAGHDRGLVVVPEVGDEVLVAFERGDVNRPFVLGGLFNGVDTPPRPTVGSRVDGATGRVTSRSWVSREGQRIDLVDGDGAGIRLASRGEMVRVRLDDAELALVLHADGQVRVSGARGVVVDAGGDLTLSGQHVSIKGAAGVSIDGPEVQVQADGRLGLRGVETSLEGSAQTEVKGGGLCRVSAAMVTIN